MRRALLWGALAISLTWAAAIVVAPKVLAGARAAAPQIDAVRTAAAVVYVGASYVCHQRPERSFWIGDRPMPVCARCTGLYFGAPLGLALLLMRRTRRSGQHAQGVHEMAPVDRAYSWWRVALVLALAPTVVSLGLEWGAGLSCNISRALTAVPFGAALGALVGAALIGRFAEGGDGGLLHYRLD